MNSEQNKIMKTLLQKIANKMISNSEFDKIKNVEFFYVFGSPVKTAMCDWVYGIKINTVITSRLREEYVRNFQLNLKTFIQKKYGQTICPTDVIFI